MITQKTLTVQKLKQTQRISKSKKLRRLKNELIKKRKKEKQKHWTVKGLPLSPPPGPKNNNTTKAVGENSKDVKIELRKKQRIEDNIKN